MKNAYQLYRVARKAVTRNLLSPSGFSAGPSLHLRKVKDQIQGLEFQAQTGGGGYLINLYLHYAYLPVFLQRRRLEWHEFEPLDFLFAGRLCRFATEPDDREPYRYLGKTDVDESLFRRVRLAISAIDYYSNLWTDPSKLIELCPPELWQRQIEADARYQDGGIDALDSLRSPPPLVEALAGRWHVSQANLSFSLAVIARRSGRFELVSQYEAVARHYCTSPSEYLLEWLESPGTA